MSTKKTSETQEHKENTKDDIIIEEKAESLEDIEARIEELSGILDEEKDKFLRLYAEFDNYRKRTAKEKEALYYDCLAEGIKALLPVADNLERAVTSSGDYETLKKGVEMVLKQLNDSFTILEIEEIPTDIAFDPHLHNAVMHIEDEGKGDGEIIEVFQKGYKIKNKIIRHAMVKVAN